jgi:alpha-amylase
MMMWKRNPYKAVTFVTNHDTDEIQQTICLCIHFNSRRLSNTLYKDYEEWLDKEKMNNLIWIHNQKATGTTSILYTDNDDTSLEEMVTTERLVYINNSSVWQERWIPTNWTNAQIKDFRVIDLDLQQVGENTMSSNGYSVWSINM